MGRANRIASAPPPPPSTNPRVTERELAREQAEQERTGLPPRGGRQEPQIPELVSPQPPILDSIPGLDDLNARRQERQETRENTLADIEAAPGRLPPSVRIPNPDVPPVGLAGLRGNQEQGPPSSPAPAPAPTSVDECEVIPPDVQDKFDRMFASDVYKKAVIQLREKKARGVERIGLTEFTNELEKLVVPYKPFKACFFRLILKKFMKDIAQPPQNPIPGVIEPSPKLPPPEPQDVTPIPDSIPVVPPVKLPNNNYTTYKDYHNLDVYSDDFSPAEARDGTYHMQKEIKRFELRDKVRKDRQRIRLVDKGMAPLDQDDLLLTHSLDHSFTNINTLGTLPNNQKDVRYYQETYRQINVNSRQRKKFQERPVIPSDRDTFPNKEIWDQFFDPESSEFQDLDVCCITFNSILGFDQEFPFFFIKEGQLWIKQPIDLSSSSYTITLEPALRHIRYIRLKSVEAPGTASNSFQEQVSLTNGNSTSVINSNTLNQINSTNNLLMLDVLDPCRCDKSFPHTAGLPFTLLLIPVGNYTIDSLLTRIVQLMNDSLKECLEGLQRPCEPFSYFYDVNTGEVDIRSDYPFHLKFWFSTTHPQFNLHEMLGYPYPFPTDENGEPAYVKSFSNMIEVPSPLTNLGLVNRQPFKKPRLNVNDYIYLAIRHLDVIKDESVVSEDLFAKIPTGGDSNYIGSTKVFFEPFNKLERFEVRWIDAFGNLVDFAGQENSFLVEAVEYQDKLKDSDYSSLRGIANYETDITKVAYKTNND
jgi:hypothetical protein